MDAKEFGREWVVAWNAHDLERIVAHYANDVVLTSPVAAKITGNASGVVRGRDALREYFAQGLALFPELRFRLLEVLEGVASVCCITKTSGARAQRSLWSSMRREES